MSKEESLIVKGVAILMMLYLHLFNQMTNVAICDNMIFIGNMPLISSPEQRTPWLSLSS